MAENRPGHAVPPGDARAAEDIAHVFAALGDPTRLHLVSLLCAGSLLSITQLTTGTDLTRQGVTKHLQVLAGAGLVHDQKVGRERYWQLAPDRIAQARHSLEAIGLQWEAALGRLKDFVESDGQSGVR